MRQGRCHQTRGGFFGVMTLSTSPEESYYKTADWRTLAEQSRAVPCVQTDG